MILGKHIGSIRIIWTVFGIYDIPTQLWVSRDLDKQGNICKLNSLQSTTLCVKMMNQEPMMERTLPQLRLEVPLSSRVRSKFGTKCDFPAYVAY